MFNLFLVMAGLLYLYMAYREVNFYFAICAETDRKPNLSMLGMFCVGMMWPKFRYLWWKVNKERRNGR